MLTPLGIIFVVLGIAWLLGNPPAGQALEASEEAELETPAVAGGSAATAAAMTARPLSQLLKPHKVLIARDPTLRDRLARVLKSPAGERLSAHCARVELMLAMFPQADPHLDERLTDALARTLLEFYLLLGPVTDVSLVRLGIRLYLDRVLISQFAPQLTPLQRAEPISRFISELDSESLWSLRLILMDIGS